VEGSPLARPTHGRHRLAFRELRADVGGARSWIGPSIITLARRESFLHFAVEKKEKRSSQYDIPARRSCAAPTRLASQHRRRRRDDSSAWVCHCSLHLAGAVFPFIVGVELYKLSPRTAGRANGPPSTIPPSTGVTATIVVYCARPPRGRASATAIVASPWSNRFLGYVRAHTRPTIHTIRRNWAT
jgi:hypothetical protein